MVDQNVDNAKAIEKKGKVQNKPMHITLRRFHDRVSDTYIHPFFNLCSMCPLYRVRDRLTSFRK